MNLCLDYTLLLHQYYFAAEQVLQTVCVHPENSLQVYCSPIQTQSLKLRQLWTSIASTDPSIGPVNEDAFTCMHAVKKQITNFKSLSIIGTNLGIGLGNKFRYLLTCRTDLHQNRRHSKLHEVYSEAYTDLIVYILAFQQMFSLETTLCWTNLQS